MKLIIHRGTKEIGGSCVEVASGTSRILIDFGIPLVTSDKIPFDTKILEGKSIEQLKALKILPDIKGLYKGEPKTIDAILISHSHLDHYGFLKYINPGIPVYLSEGAKRLIEISDIFTPHKTGKLNTVVLDKWKEISINGFKVTGYLVDHSAFDALAFLIESEGKRIFYSGDFRGHGRKSVLFKEMIKKPPAKIDYLLMEGSMLGREKKGCETESDIQNEIENTLRGKSNIAFLFASSQNIDRLVSVYKACRKTGTTFVIDLYAAYILEKLHEITPNIPRYNWDNIRIKFFNYHADRLAGVSKPMLYKFNGRKMEIDELNSDKNKILMLARDNSLFRKIVEKIKDIKGAIIIYSMWEGYLTKEFKNECAQKGIEIKHIHTSGHAVIKDLKEFAKAINPKNIIPIHTFHGNEYKNIFPAKVIELKDGEKMEL